MTRRSRLSTYMIAAALVCAVAPPAAAQRDRDEYESRIDTTFAFSRNGSVELQAYNGDIIVSGWNRDQVRVRATSERSALRIDASQSFVSLSLRSGASRSGDTRFEVTVPVGARVKANTTSGDIRITGSRGEVEARTQRGDIVVEEATRTEISAFSGDVEATAVAGDLAVNALNGDIRVRGVTGRVEIKTVSGEIAVRDARSSDVRLGSTSGDILFDGTIDAAGRYALQTHSGEVELTLPSNVRAQLTVSTFNGEVESDFPLVLEPRTHGDAGSHGRSFTFTLGRGGSGARITAESFSGDITIRSRGGPGGGPGDRLGEDR